MSLRDHFDAWSALLRRYAGVFLHSWRHRDDLSLPDYSAAEADFLPAALSLQAQPVSPAGRWVARILMLLIAAVLLWAIFGRMDIIVNATGKIIPSQRTKTIAAVEVASVRALHVEEGQTVKAGQVLIELDARESNSLRDKAMADEQAARLQAARSRALMAAIDSGVAPHLAPISGVAKDRWQDAVSHLRDQWADYRAKRQQLEDAIRRYGAALPLATQQAADYAALAKDHDVPEHAWMDKEQTRIEINAQLNDARDQLRFLTADTRKTAQDALYEAERTLAESAQDARRAAVHSQLLKLVSPVDGTVQQLTVHTIGGVVPAAQSLMEIVPKQSAIEIEAFLENKDVGFVREGQPAEVKIDAFEYTKYGTVAGQVIHVSRDAIQDEKKNWVYSVIIRLDRSVMDIDGHKVALTPGMSSDVEIKTGERRVIEYVLSPFVRHVRESLHER